MADIEKQPYESFVIAGSILSVMETAEVVLVGSSTVTATDTDGLDVSTTFLDQTSIVVGDDPDGGTDNALEVRIRAGSEAGSPYKVTFQMTTDLTNQYEVDRTVKVKEQ